MPRTYIKVEYFEYIEQCGPIGVSVEEFAKKFYIRRQHAAVWLSKWAGRGYLTRIPYNISAKPMVTEKKGRPKGTAGRYKIGPEWWGELAYGGQALGI